MGLTVVETSQPRRPHAPTTWPPEPLANRAVTLRLDSHSSRVVLIKRSPTYTSLKRLSCAGRGLNLYDVSKCDITAKHPPAGPSATGVCAAHTSRMASVCGRSGSLPWADLPLRGFQVTLFVCSRSVSRRVTVSTTELTSSGLYKNTSAPASRVSGPNGVAESTMIGI